MMCIVITYKLGWGDPLPSPPPRSKQAGLSAVDSSPLPLPPPWPGAGIMADIKKMERVIVSVEWRVGKGEQGECGEQRMWSVESVVS